MKRMCSRWYSSARSGCFSRRWANAFSTRSSSLSPRIISPHGQASLVFISVPLDRLRCTPTLGASAVVEDEAAPLPGVPHVLVLAPSLDAVEVPTGVAGPVEHVRVRVEHAPAGGHADCMQGAPAVVDGVDGDAARSALVVALDRPLAVDEVCPFTVAQEVPAENPVVAL